MAQKFPTTELDMLQIYELFVHLSSLYASALAANKDSPEAELWHDLTNFMIGDLGNTLKIWEGLKVPMAAGFVEPIKRRKASLEKRFRILAAHMTIWSGSKECLQTVIGCERMWLRFLEKITQAGQDPREATLSTLSATAERLQNLEKLLVQVQARISETNACYGVPTAMLPQAS